MVTEGFDDLPHAVELAALQSLLGVRPPQQDGNPGGSRVFRTGDPVTAGSSSLKHNVSEHRQNADVDDDVLTAWPSPPRFPVGDALGADADLSGYRCLTDACRFTDAAAGDWCRECGSSRDLFPERCSSHRVWYRAVEAIQLRSHNLRGRVRDDQ